MQANTVRFFGLNSSYQEARAVIFGAPYDGTASFKPGARFGPDAMRRESHALESYSPYQDADLADYAIFDAGDLQLTLGHANLVLDRIEQFTAGILADQKLPVMLGGEHLVTLGAFRAVQRAYPQVELLHLDAHTDLRDDLEGERLSHATVMKHCWRLLAGGRLHQFGIRSGLKEEFEFARSELAFYPFTLDDFAAVASGLGDRPVYLTIDLDVLDPSVFPGTGTPEPGGVSFEALRRALLAVRDLRLVGLDLVELSPPADLSGVSTAVALKLLRELLISVFCRMV